ncbi:MAG: hypothetical protein V1775_04875 [Bacteroidota bacterium]
MAGLEIENPEQYKGQETKRQLNFISENNFWITDIEFSLFLISGAGKKVYLKDPESELKQNDAIIRVNKCKHNLKVQP